MKFFSKFDSVRFREKKQFQTKIFLKIVFSKKTVSESVRLAESIGDVRALLQKILSDKPINGAHKELTDAVLEECHKTLVSIFHALYPTPFLKWTCLCDLLSKTDKVSLFLFFLND